MWTQPPPPPPRANEGITAFWARRSRTGKTGITVVALMVVAAIVNPNSGQPSPSSRPLAGVQPSPTDRAAQAPAVFDTATPRATDTSPATPSPKPTPTNIISAE